MATQVFKNISATPPNFYLSGGQYAIVANGTTWGTATLQLLSDDNVTWLPVGTAISANGIAPPTWLPAGTYRLLLSGASGLYVKIVPYTA